VKPEHTWKAALVALAGAGICLTAITHFLLTIRYNRLPWSPGQHARDHYLAVGHSYTQGFIVGFFLCLSLAVAAAAVAAWRQGAGDGGQEG
jgi:hypothetical protein